MAEEKKIWDTLLAGIGNPYGVAGLMGNLFAESSLNPLCKTGGDSSVKGWQYAQMVDDSTIDIQTFSHDGVAFGLAQWRYWSRKEGLYNIWLMQKAGTSIGDLDFQLEYLLFEIETYQTVWNTLKNAKTVKEASDIVLEKYERPASVGDKTKEKRASFGQGYFDKYAVHDDPTPEGVWVRTKTDKVNIRQGNGSKFSIITQIPVKGTKFPWVATSENGWYAVDLSGIKKREVGWVTKEFAEVIRE